LLLLLHCRRVLQSKAYFIKIFGICCNCNKIHIVDIYTCIIALTVLEYRVLTVVLKQPEKQSNRVTIKITREVYIVI